jgi:hypothetical protein
LLLRIYTLIKLRLRIVPQTTNFDRVLLKFETFFHYDNYVEQLLDVMNGGDYLAGRELSPLEVPRKFYERFSATKNRHSESFPIKSSFKLVTSRR